jgi:GTP cyclohydrolase I
VSDTARCIRLLRPVSFISDGLRETPRRLVKAFSEYFCGYQQDLEQILQTAFEETGGYDEMVVLRGVPFESHCEHHVAPIVGRAWVAYVPLRRVVGISKLARVSRFTQNGFRSRSV